LKQEDKKSNYGRKSKTVPKGRKNRKIKKGQRREKQKAKEKQNKNIGGLKKLFTRHEQYYNFYSPCLYRKSLHQSLDLKLP